MSDWVKAILTNGAVWGAFVALLNGVVAYFLPDFPKELLTLANVLVFAVLGAVGIFAPNGARARVKAIRLARAKGEYKPPSG